MFKVPWLKTSDSDGHFDLIDSNQLVGKTLAWTSKALYFQGFDSVTVQNCTVLGLAVQAQNERVAKKLEQFKANKIGLHRDVVSFTVNPEMKPHGALFFRIGSRGGLYYFEVKKPKPK